MMQFLLEILFVVFVNGCDQSVSEYDNTGDIWTTNIDLFDGTFYADINIDDMITVSSPNNTLSVQCYSINNCVFKVFGDQKILIQFMYNDIGTNNFILNFDACNIPCNIIISYFDCNHNILGKFQSHSINYNLIIKNNTLPISYAIIQSLNGAQISQIGFNILEYKLDTPSLESDSKIGKKSKAFMIIIIVAAVMVLLFSVPIYCLCSWIDFQRRLKIKHNPPTNNDTGPTIEDNAIVIEDYFESKHSLNSMKKNNKGIFESFVMVEHDMIEQGINDENDTNTDDDDNDVLHSMINTQDITMNTNDLLNDVLNDGGNNHQNNDGNGMNISSNENVKLVDDSKYSHEGNNQHVYRSSFQENYNML